MSNNFEAIIEDATVSLEEILFEDRSSIKIGPFGSQLNKRLLVVNGPFKVFGQENVFRNDFRLGSRRVSKERFDLLKSCAIKEGDVVVTMAGTVGKSAIVPSGIERGIMDSHLIRLRINPKIYDKRLIIKLMASEYVIQQIRSLSVGSIMEGLSSSIVRRLRFPKLSLPVQKKIARILTTIDNLIEKTEALIAKYKSIKKGMMHDLFTRGVDQEGKLRPPYEQAPQLYKDSELGKIPKEWEVDRLVSLLADVDSPMKSGPFGSALLKSELVESGIPFLGIDNVHRERFVPRFSRFISDEKYLELKKFTVRPNDVMITIMGTVGRCCVVPAGLERMISSKHVWTMTFDSKKYLPDLICWQLNYASWTLRQIERGAQGGIMEAISSAILRRILFPVPPPFEQNAICKTYQTLNSKIDAALEHLAKMKSAKTGLMQDLLTGKVRVNVDELEEELTSV